MSWNPTLPRMFSCHLKVEQCISRVSGIKYLLKYVGKGSGRVTVRMRGVNKTEVYHEITTFQDARYVFESKAV